MTTLTLYYATNRAHEGDDRWRPERYGARFSADGMENLRFGRLTLEAEEERIKKFVNADLGACGRGNGEKLADYLAKCSAQADIRAFPEKLDTSTADTNQPEAKLGSKAMFGELKDWMMQASDVVVFVHGFNVSWESAIGSALALQTMLQLSPAADPAQKVAVVLFTWPSDGLALPFVSYKSDRSEAAGSGNAFGRGLLKVRDFLAALRDRARKGGEVLCEQDIHLLCHSMGNFLLQNALERMDTFTPGNVLPRLFGNVFLCAPDVDDVVLEPGQPLGRVNEIARGVSVYHNRGDVAMVVSDYTKGNPERLGGAGAARPALLHNKVEQVDCTPIVSGMVEHSYFLSGHVNADIRQSIDGMATGDPGRRRVADAAAPNVWRMR